MNSLSSLFEIYLIMLSQKARNKNKLSNLQVFFSNLEDKERCMKQITKVNFAQLQNIISGGISSKSGFNLYIQGN